MMLNNEGVVEERQDKSGFWGSGFEYDPKTGLFMPKKTGVDLVSVEDLVMVLESTTKELDFSMSENAIVDALLIGLEAFTLVEHENKKYVPKQEAAGFIANWVEAIVERDYEYLTMRRGLKVNKIVDLEEFAESKEFLNQKKALRPKIKQTLLDFWPKYDDTVEVVLGGATGIGKTYMASIIMNYMLYKLSCYHNPQLEFFLAPGTSIVFTVQSASLSLAKKVAFDALGGMIRQSPYFQQHFQFDKNVKTELRFPKSIYVFPLSGSDTSALGLNVFGGILDELNFLKVVANSARGTASGVDGYDQAASIYNTIITRIKGRFQNKGSIPGKLLLLSSANYPGDFTSTKEAEAEAEIATYAKSGNPKDKPTIHVIKMAQWESIPADRFCGDTFLVEVGNESKTSKILRCRADAFEETDILEIPIEYEKAFRNDIEKSLRDIAGIAVGGKNLFIPYRSKVEEAQLNFETLYPEGQLFLYDELVFEEVLPDMMRPDYELLINKPHLESLLLDTNTPFALHVDLGITKDAAGVSVSRITGYKLVPSTKIYDPGTGLISDVKDERMPIITTHGVMRITGGGGEVDIDVLTDFIIYLKRYINIKYATMDSFQSRTALQRLKKHHIIVGVVSTDTDPEVYTEARSAFKDERTIMPRHHVLAYEYCNLKRAADGSIDHDVDKCFVADTLVHTSTGDYTIKDMAEAWDLGIRFEVLSIDPASGVIEYEKAVHPRLTKYTKELAEITTERGVHRCTPDHKIRTTVGDVQAQHLTPEHNIMCCFKGLFSEFKSVKLIRLSKRVPVYDLTTEKNHTFCLATGEVVHNSKDVSDSHACSQFVLLKREANFATAATRAVGGTRIGGRTNSSRNIKNVRSSNKGGRQVGRLRSRLGGRG